MPTNDAEKENSTDNEPSRRVLLAAIAGLAPPALLAHAEDAPDARGDVAATKRAILARLDGPGLVASSEQLAAALAIDGHTLRLAPEALQDGGRLQPTAVSWRPDRHDGHAFPLEARR